VLQAGSEAFAAAQSQQAGHYRFEIADEARYAARVSEICEARKITPSWRYQNETEAGNEIGKRRAVEMVSSPNSEECQLTRNLLTQNTAENFRRVLLLGLNAPFQSHHLKELPEQPDLIAMIC
jgi:hypothetical protein